jgi:hypothetical protein
MADKVTASEFNTFATRYNTVKGSVTFPDSSGLDLGAVATVTQGQVCRKASLSELRRAVCVTGEYPGAGGGAGEAGGAVCAAGTKRAKLPSLREAKTTEVQCEKSQ